MNNNIRCTVKSWCGAVRPYRGHVSWTDETGCECSWTSGACASEGGAMRIAQAKAATLAQSEQVSK